MSQNTSKKAPSINAVKILLRDSLNHGDQEEMADRLGILPAELSRRLQVDGNRKPDLYGGLRECWAATETNQDAGWKLKAAIDALFDSWLEPVKATDKNLTLLIKEAQESLTALVTAKLDNKPLRDLKEEARSVRKAMDQLLDGLDNEFELRAETGSNVKEIRR